MTEPSTVSPLEGLGAHLLKVAEQEGAGPRLRAAKPWAVRTWAGYLGALRALPVCTITLSESPSGRHIRRLLDQRAGPFRARWAMDVIELPSTFEEYLASRRRTNGVRESLRRGRKLGISTRRVDDPDEQRANLVDLLARRDWEADPVAQLERQHDLRPGEGIHVACRDADGILLALAIAVLDGTTAQLAFCTSTPDRELSSFSRYQVCAEIVAQAIKGQATVLLGDGHLLLKPGLRQFAKAVGFLPERVVIAGSARRGLS